MWCHGLKLSATTRWDCNIEKGHTNGRQVLECGSPLPLLGGGGTFKSGRGLPHSKTLPRLRRRRGASQSFIDREECLSCEPKPDASRLRSSKTCWRTKLFVTAVNQTAPCFFISASNLNARKTCRRRFLRVYCPRMLPTRQGSFHLFRFAGIDVFLHWSWFLVVVYAISLRATVYTSLVWNVLEYVALFAIVLTHEFGHSLACQQVGGQADQIVLWPLGGVAYVNPPPRPGATLWSIAAGPLVNVALIPVLTFLRVVIGLLIDPLAMPNLHTFLYTIWWVNLALLIFNLLPIYPLDGGQILRSLLWFPLGRARSLLVTSMIGFVGVIALVALAVFVHSVWLGIMAAFILMNCWRGLMLARAMTRAAQAPNFPNYD